MQEMQVPFLGWEDPLEKEMATHFRSHGQGSLGNVLFKRGVAVGHSEEDYAKHQIITLENWLVVEESGAIFLPVTEDNM